MALTFFTLQGVFTSVSRGMLTTLIVWAFVSSRPTRMVSVLAPALSLPTTRKV